MGAHFSFPRTSTIRRTFDATHLNAIANDPAVFPWMESKIPVDMSMVALDAANFLLECDDGGFLLIQHEPGRYEVHSIFKPDAGATTIRAMREAMDWMFTRTPCEAICSKIPDGNDRAHGFAIAGGLREIFRGADASYVEIGIMDWAMRTKALQVHGERFHATLDAAKLASGSPLPVHDYDVAHERAVGAALLMIERGQPAKGIAFYNRWARIAGYAQIRLFSTAPVIVDVVDAVVGIGTDGLEVLLCR